MLRKSRRRTFGLAIIAVVVILGALWYRTHPQDIVFAGENSTRLIDRYADRMAKYADPNFYEGHFQQRPRTEGECAYFGLQRHGAVTIAMVSAQHLALTINDLPFTLTGSDPSQFDMYYYTGELSSIRYEVAISTQRRAETGDDLLALFLTGAGHHCTALFDRTAVFDLQSTKIN
ncbi:MAG: hypothetical protein HYV02_01160 [Deltaproteobacteria bacterium]|nr:hypothetical protein [Deltaproteobacteria bacterium]